MPHSTGNALPFAEKASDELQILKVVWTSPLLLVAYGRRRPTAEETYHSAIVRQAAFVKLPYPL